MNHILLIDADPVTGGILIDRLRTEGFEVDAVQPAALDEAVGRRYALVILNASCDLRDDVTLLSCLREAHGHTPVIVVDSRGERAARRRAFEMGALDYITGAANVHELVARVRAALRHYHAPRGDSIHGIDELFDHHWAAVVREPDYAFAPIDITLAEPT